MSQPNAVDPQKRFSDFVIASRVSGVEPPKETIDADFERLLSKNIIARFFPRNSNRDTYPLEQSEEKAFSYFFQEDREGFSAQEMRALFQEMQDLLKDPEIFKKPGWSKTQQKIQTLSKISPPATNSKMAIFLEEFAIGSMLYPAAVPGFAQLCLSLEKIGLLTPDLVNNFSSVRKVSYEIKQKYEALPEVKLRAVKKNIKRNEESLKVTVAGFEDLCEILRKIDEENKKLSTAWPPSSPNFSGRKANQRRENRTKIIRQEAMRDLIPDMNRYMNRFLEIANKHIAMLEAYNKQEQTGAFGTETERRNLPEECAELTYLVLAIKKAILTALVTNSDDAGAFELDERVAAPILRYLLQNQHGILIPTELKRLQDADKTGYKAVYELLDKTLLKDGTIEVLGLIEKLAKKTISKEEAQQEAALQKPLAADRAKIPEGVAGKILTQFEAAQKILKLDFPGLLKSLTELKSQSTEEIQDVLSMLAARIKEAQKELDRLEKNPSADMVKAREDMAFKILPSLIAVSHLAMLKVGDDHAKKDALWVEHTVGGEKRRGIRTDYANLLPARQALARLGGMYFALMGEIQHDKDIPPDLAQVFHVCNVLARMVNNKEMRNHLKSLKSNTLDAADDLLTALEHASTKERMLEIVNSPECKDCVQEIGKIVAEKIKQKSDKKTLPKAEIEKLFNDRGQLVLVSNADKQKNADYVAIAASCRALGLEVTLHSRASSTLTIPSGRGASTDSPAASTEFDPSSSSEEKDSRHSSRPSISITSSASSKSGAEEDWHIVEMDRPQLSPRSVSDEKSPTPPPRKGPRKPESVLPIGNPTGVQVGRPADLSKQLAEELQQRIKRLEPAAPVVKKGPIPPPLPANLPAARGSVSEPKPADPKPAVIFNRQSTLPAGFNLKELQQAVKNHHEPKPGSQGNGSQGKGLKK